MIRLKQGVYKEQVDQINLKKGCRELFQKARYIKLQRLAAQKGYKSSGYLNPFESMAKATPLLFSKIPKLVLKSLCYILFLL